MVPDRGPPSRRTGSSGGLTRRSAGLENVALRGELPGKLGVGMAGKPMVPSEGKMVTIGGAVSGESPATKLIVDPPAAPKAATFPAKSVNANTFTPYDFPSIRAQRRFTDTHHP